MQVYGCRPGSSANSHPLKMIAVELLSNSLDETAKFLQAQKDLDIFPQVVEQQCQGLLRRCQVLPTLSAGDAAELIEKVKETLGGMAKVNPLVLAISAKVLAAPTATEKRQKQTITNFAGYLTQKDHDVLQNSQVSKYTKLDHVATRMIRLGIDVPTEVSVGHILKLLGCKTMHVYSAS